MRRTTIGIMAIAMLLVMGLIAPAAAEEQPPREPGKCETWVPPTYKEVVDQEARTETIEHEAEYEYIEHPAIDPVIEPGIWANWAPNDTQGPQDYTPIWPNDERGTWIVHDEVPPGHAGPDGVYQQGGGNSPWFYRQAEEVITEGKDAWTEMKLVKDAWTETIEHPATYKRVVDEEGRFEPILDCKPDPKPDPDEDPVVVIPLPDPVTICPDEIIDEDGNCVPPVLDCASGPDPDSQEFEDAAEWREWHEENCVEDEAPEPEPEEPTEPTEPEEEQEIVTIQRTASAETLPVTGGNAALLALLAALLLGGGIGTLALGRRNQ